MKPKKYGLRGGFIAVTVFILLLVILFFTDLIQAKIYQTQCLIGPCPKVLHFYLFGSGRPNLVAMDINQFLVTWVIIIILTFVVGMIMVGFMEKLRDIVNKK